MENTKIMEVKTMENTIFDYQQTELEQMVEEYFIKKARLEEEQKALKELNAKIVSELEKTGVKKGEYGEYNVTLSYSTKFLYNDERSLMTKLKGDENLKSYVVESINTTALNKLLKESQSLATDLKDFYTTRVDTSLKITKR